MVGSFPEGIGMQGLVSSSVVGSIGFSGSDDIQRSEINTPV